VVPLIRKIATAGNAYSPLHDLIVAVFGANFAEAMRRAPKPLEDAEVLEWLRTIDIEALGKKVRCIRTLRDAHRFVNDQATFDEALLIDGSLRHLALLAEDMASGEMWYREWVVRLRLCRTVADVIELAIAANYTSETEPSPPGTELP
jgi:hypothetical protein